MCPKHGLATECGIWTVRVRLSSIIVLKKYVGVKTGPGARPVRACLVGWCWWGGDCWPAGVLSRRGGRSRADNLWLSAGGLLGCCKRGKGELEKGVGRSWIDGAGWPCFSGCSRVPGRLCRLRLD